MPGPCHGYATATPWLECSALLDHTFLLFFSDPFHWGASPPQTPHSQSAFGLRVEDEPKEVNVWVTKSAPARQWRHLCHTLGYWGVRIYLEDLQNMWNLLGNSEIMTATIEKGWHLGKCRKNVGGKSSQNEVCLVWKMFPHLGRVFLSYLEVRSSHILKNQELTGN